MPTGGNEKRPTKPAPPRRSVQHQAALSGTPGSTGGPPARPPSPPAPAPGTPSAGAARSGPRTSPSLRKGDMGVAQLRKVRERRRKVAQHRKQRAASPEHRTPREPCRTEHHNTARRSGHTPASYHTTKSSTSGRLRPKLSFSACTCLPSTGRTCPLLWLSSSTSSSPVGECSTAAGGSTPHPPGGTPSCSAQSPPQKKARVHPVQLDHPRLRLQMLSHLRHRRQLANRRSLGSHGTSRDTPSPAKRDRKGAHPFKSWQIQGKRKRFQKSKPPIWTSEFC